MAISVLYSRVIDHTPKGYMCTDPAAEQSDIYPGRDVGVDREKELSDYVRYKWSYPALYQQATVVREQK